MTVIREPNIEPLPGYRLIEPLGNGGFGEVWKCEAPGGLFKAIKFVYGNLNCLDTEAARAEQELNALQRVKEVRHPFVLSMERIEIVDGEVVIVMELADKSLHDSLVEHQSAGLVGIPRDALLRYLRDAAEALDHMNEKHNLQHLDIKPRNLFLVSDRVKVADFGLVKHLERASGVLGGVTPLYAAPETFTGKISNHSDQYSLAIVYQELLTGQRPFNGKNPRQLAQQHLNDEPELRALPEAERPVVARALAKDPAKRFPNCLAFLRALYMARGVPRLLEPVSPEPATSGQRPKTLKDTLEDIQLEGLPSSDDEWKALPEPSAEPEEPISELGMTVHQPETGALRPTLLIGVGSFGRRALLELRCRLLDRFGDLTKVPMIRFLYLDIDPDEIKAAPRGAADVTFATHEVHHLPLQPVAHYRRRQLDQLNDWLPREKLYGMPRNLKTQGCRALGRLAFCDNYLRLLARLRRDLQQVCHPDAIFQTVSQTGLAVRDNVPRVCVLAAAGGGTSGMLSDLGYAIRRLLHQLRHNDSALTAYLLCGAPEDPATPRAEQANLYATLTELYHFGDPTVPFTAQYGTDGPRIVDQGQAFDATYLLAMANRTPEARQDAIAHLGSFLFHELTTPLGLRLDQRRLGSSNGPTPFRTFGTYSVWFPRGLVLRLAARQACRRIVEEWQAQPGRDSSIRQRRTLVTDVGPTDTPEVTAVCARAMADPGLLPEALTSRLEDIAARSLEGSPAEALTRLLGSLEDQAQQHVALDDPGSWAKSAVRRVQEWLGPGLSQTSDPRVALFQTEWRKSKLNRALEAGADQMAEQWEARLTQATLELMEAPGRRVAMAEAGLQRIEARVREEAEAYKARLLQSAQRVPQAQAALQSALDGCANSNTGFSFFGNRSRRSLRLFLDHLAAFARSCLAEDLAAAVQLFWNRLQGRLAERLRDMTLCRMRLRNLYESLLDPDIEYALTGDTDPTDSSMSPSPVDSATSFWEAIRHSAATTRVVLPEGETDLEVVAGRFLAGLTPEIWVQLDQTLGEEVLAPLGGLAHVCMHGGNITRGLLTPMLERLTSRLGEYLPITDVAQVLMDGGPDPEEAQEATATITDCFTRAAPLLGARALTQSGTARAAVLRRHAGRNDDPAEEAPDGFLLTPGSEAGKQFGERAQAVLPNLQLVRVAGQNALLFCREQGALSLEELHRLLQPCRAAYEESAFSPQSSPHARCDINDWLPLDP